MVKGYSFGGDNDLTEEDLLKYMRRKAWQYLRNTDWTQVADEPLRMEVRKEYREYRQYLRNIDLIWKNKQMTEPSVMRFEQWKENKPRFRYNQYEIWYLKED